MTMPVTSPQGKMPLDRRAQNWHNTIPIFRSMAY
jgi:hypothetical protein